MLIYHICCYLCYLHSRLLGRRANSVCRMISLHETDSVVQVVFSVLLVFVMRRTRVRVIQEVWYGTEVVKKIRFRHHNVAVRISSLIVETDKNVTRQHGNGLNESLCVLDRGCGIENAKYIPPPSLISYTVFLFSPFIQMKSFHRV
jgi:hypothetical protein